MQLLRFAASAAPVSLPASSPLSALVFSYDYNYNSAACRQLGATAKASVPAARDLLETVRFQVVFIVVPVTARPGHAQFRLAKHAMGCAAPTICLVHAGNRYVDEWLYGMAAPCGTLLHSVCLTAENTRLAYSPGGCLVAVPNWAKLASRVAHLSA